VRPGDVLVDVGALADITDHVVAGRSVVFLGRLDDGRDVIGWWRDGRVRTTVADGEQSGGRTLDLGSPLVRATQATGLLGGGGFDANGETAAHATSLVIVRQKGRPTLLRSPSGRRFDYFALQTATLAGRRAVALTDSALFATRGARLTPVLIADGKGP